MCQHWRHRADGRAQDGSPSHTAFRGITAWNFVKLTRPYICILTQLKVENTNIPKWQNSEQYVSSLNWKLEIFGIGGSSEYPRPLNYKSLHKINISIILPWVIRNTTFVKHLYLCGCLTTMSEMCPCRPSWISKVTLQMATFYFRKFSNGSVLEWEFVLDGHAYFCDTV